MSDWPKLMNCSDSTIYKQQLINPRADLRTRIDMVPQSSKPFLFDHSQPQIDVTAYFTERFPHPHLTYTSSGTQAIQLALSQLNLQPDDVVTILTTSQNFYVSGCITKTIETYCRWSREIEPTTKVLYVNHEFGFPYENLTPLASLGYPIIEDCAYAFCANNAEHAVGKIGNYIIFSLPKFFPMQMGGLLLSHQSIKSPLTNDLVDHIAQQLQHFLSQTHLYAEKRRDLYHLYHQYFSTLTDYKQRFDLKEYHVPGAFLFHAPAILDLPELKRFYTRQGVESSVFYGEQVYFLPLHQNLTETDIAYLHALTEYFYSQSLLGIKVV